MEKLRKIEKKNQEKEKVKRGNFKHKYMDKKG